MIRALDHSLVLFGASEDSDGIHAEFCVISSDMGASAPIEVKGKEKWIEIPQELQGLETPAIPHKISPIYFRYVQ